jgi:hypothetical protein
MSRRWLSGRQPRYDVEFVSVDSRAEGITTLKNQRNQGRSRLIYCILVNNAFYKIDAVLNPKFIDGF